MIGVAPLGTQLTRAGLVLGLLGALAFTYGAAVMVLSSRSYHGPTDSDHRREKMAYLIAGLLLAGGFALHLIGTFTR